MEKNKRIVLIENKSQASEYLKNKEKFKDALPITFDFPSEEILLNANINFKTEEEYETDNIYKGIYDLSLKNTKEICKKIKINYRGIELFQLFYMDLFKFLGVSRRYLKLFKKINEIEEVNKVIVFSNSCLKFKDRIFSKIAQEIFKDKLKTVEYGQKIEENNFLIKTVGFMQNIFSKGRLFLLKKEDNKIFLCGHKTLYESLLEGLLKNKNNKIFRCHDNLQKSFFISRKCISFYEFSKEKSVHQINLIKDIKKFKEDWRNYEIESLIEESLKPTVKDWIYYYVETKFMEISGVINHMIRLIKKNKINLIVVFADTIVFEKTFVRVGRLFNIPSIVLLNGLIGHGVYPSVYPSSSNYILVFGEESKNILMSFGLPKDKIIITGSPQFDKYNKKGLDKKIKKGKIVFILSGHPSKDPSPEAHLTKKMKKNLLRMLFRALKKFPEYNLIIKGRKGWDMNNLPQIIANEEEYDITFVEEIESIELLSDAEIVIVTNTTMALDALLLDKPVISIWFKNMERFSGFKDSKTIKTVYNQEQLEKAIKECKVQTKEDKLEREKYLKHELFNVEGNSSKRVEEIINKLCSMKNESK